MFALRRCVVQLITRVKVLPKRKFLTLVERVIVKELNNKNRSAGKIAEDFGVGKTQFQNTLKRKAQVLEDYENTISGARKRLCRTSDNDEINELVSRCCQMPVSGPLIQQQALKFVKDLNNDTFKASNGWLDVVLKRNNKVLRTMVREVMLTQPMLMTGRKNILHYVRSTDLKTF